MYKTGFDMLLERAECLYLKRDYWEERTHERLYYRVI